MRDKNPEDVLKIYAELLRDKLKRPIMSDSVLINKWFEFDMRVSAARCLSVPNRPHQALDVLRPVDVPLDSESYRAFQSLCFELLVAMNRKVGFENPGVFHEIGSYYARFGKINSPWSRMKTRFIVLSEWRQLEQSKIEGARSPGFAIAER